MFSVFSSAGDGGTLTEVTNGNQRVTCKSLKDKRILGSGQSTKQVQAGREV